MASIASARQPPSGNANNGITPTKSKRSAPSSSSSSSSSEFTLINLKVELRLLPPNLTEEDFFKQLAQTWVKPFESKYYVQGSYPDNNYESPQYSRAYLYFKNELVLNEFVLVMKGKSFEELDTKDNLVPIIEKSLFVKMPDDNNLALTKRQKDAVNSRLETNPFYKRFLEFLQNGNTGKGEFSLLNPEKPESKRIPREKKKKKSKSDAAKEISKTTTAKVQKDIPKPKDSSKKSKSRKAKDQKVKAENDEKALDSQSKEKSKKVETKQNKKAKKQESSKSDNTKELVQTPNSDSAKGDSAKVQPIKASKPEKIGAKDDPAESATLSADAKQKRIRKPKDKKKGTEATPETTTAPKQKAKRSRKSNAKPESKATTNEAQKGTTDAKSKSTSGESLKKLQ